MKSSAARIYDPAQGRPEILERMIIRLGTAAVAQHYGVKPATVRGWLRGIHRPARRTVERAARKLF